MTSSGRVTPVRSVRRFVRLHGRSLLVLLIRVIVVLPAVLMWARVHPSRIRIDDDPGRHGLRYEDIAFPSPLDGTILRGWYTSPRGLPAVSSSSCRGLTATGS